MIDFRLSVCRVAASSNKSFQRTRKSAGPLNSTLSIKIMNAQGRDNTKRNKNIGTKKQGHGQDNHLTIPQPSDTSKYFYERFQEASVEYIQVHGREIPVIIEKLNNGFYYSFNAQEAQVLFNSLPQEDLKEFGLLVFRQPKKKELYLSSCWGRLIYSFEFKNDFLPAIIIEAVEDWETFSFSKKQSVERKLEFELLKKDGLEFKLTKRNYVAEINQDIVKSIQLHRTLLHEVGHYVHYLNVVVRPGSEDEEYEEYEKRTDYYFSIPVIEKESFANKYALEQKKRLQCFGIIK